MRVQQTLMSQEQRQLVEHLTNNYGPLQMQPISLGDDLYLQSPSGLVSLVVHRSGTVTMWLHDNGEYLLGIVCHVDRPAEMTSRLGDAPLKEWQAYELQPLLHVVGAYVGDLSQVYAQLF